MIPGCHGAPDERGISDASAYLDSRADVFQPSGSAMVELRGSAHLMLWLTIRSTITRKEIEEAFAAFRYV